MKKTVISLKGQQNSTTVWAWVVSNAPERSQKSSVNHLTASIALLLNGRHYSSHLI